LVGFELPVRGNELGRRAAACGACPHFSLGRGCSCPGGPDFRSAAFGTAGDACPLGRWGSPAAEPVLDPDLFLTTARLAADAAALARRVPAAVDGVVAVVRSGAVPAGVMATHLHVPLYAVHKARGVTRPGHGWRLEVGGEPEPRHLLVVDDTAHSGAAMAAAAARVREEFPAAAVTTAVVYCHPRARAGVDLCHATLAGNHFLEWNWANTGHGETCAFDFDGIIAEDCPVEDDDDGPRYRAFLAAARPLYLPRRAPVPLIATGRPEWARALTEEWLRRHGVRWDKLVMRDFPRPAGPDWVHAMASHKARALAGGGLRLFAESEPAQARLIADMAGLPVLCPAAGRLLRPGPPAAPPFCASLGDRVEFRVDCPSGRGCRHDCVSARLDVRTRLGDPMQAVPAEDCVDCPGFAPRPPSPSSGGCGC
jgi:hypoxanthine phosphoribosyltransferase